MEDILAVYKRPRDGDHPLVCLDEASKQLLADTRSPIPMKPGHPERGDYKYKRNGTANLFMMFAPLEGWRHIEITDRRTAIDYAQTLAALSDTHFKNAKRSSWCRTISIPTNLPRFMRHSRRTKQGGLLNASNGITRPSTAAG
jgi:DDE superfamily endonuclease